MARELTSAQKAAMVVMSLDEDQAAALLKHMSEKALAKLHEAAESLNVAQFSNEEKKKALHGFFLRQREGGMFLGDPDERFRRALIKAKGEEGAQRIYRGVDIERDTGPTYNSPIEFINHAPEDQVASVLQNESPRCCVVLLSSLPADKSGRILNKLEVDKREAIVERLLASETASPEIAEQVLLGFREKLEELATKSATRNEEQRAKDMANVINNMDKESREKVLTRTRERDPEMADRLERLMFPFEGLLKVGGRSMQELLRKYDDNVLALALKGAPKDLLDHFFSNMSQRVRERIEEQMQVVGRVAMSQVLEAREEIMKVARKMYRDGELEVELGGEEYVE